MLLQLNKNYNELSQIQTNRIWIEPDYVCVTCNDSSVDILKTLRIDFENMDEDKLEDANNIAIQLSKNPGIQFDVCNG